MKRDCPSANAEGCPYIEEGCFSNQHHQLWPSYEYTGVIPNKFRDLPENKQQLCAWEHDQIHITQPPPEKPSIQFMAETIIASGVHISRRVRKALKGAV